MTEPWKKNWNESAVEGGVPEQETGVLPWLKSWIGGSKPSASKKSVEAKPVDNQFDQVFNKLIMAESGGKHTTAIGKLTTSPVGAEGITQVMPKTASKPGFGVEPMRDKTEAEFKRFGRDYLKAMLNEFGGDYSKALAAYNAGPQSVKNAIKKGGEDWMNFLPKKEETISYIRRILGDKGA